MEDLCEKYKRDIFITAIFFCFLTGCGKETVRAALKKLGSTRKKTDTIQGAGREKSKCIFKKIIRSRFRQGNNLY